MNYKIGLTFVLLVNMLLLGGCACFQRSPSLRHVSWQEHQAKSQDITSWITSGAFSITYAKKRDVARFRWEQNPNSYIINIFDPLNISRGQIIGGGDGVEFWRTNKQCVRASTPEQLMLTQLGWKLPVSNIRYWVLAMPVPNTKVEAISFDQYGHLIYLSQDGWQVKYSEYILNHRKNMELPRVIELANEKIAIKIKITNQDLG